MNIAAPQMFWLLLILVVPLILFFWWAWRKRQQLVTQFISARLLGHLKVGVSPSRQKARMALIVIAVILLIIALARLQWGTSNEEVRQRGLDIVVAVDTSNSMLAEDVSPSRLARAKLAALDLMHKAKTDRLGLVAFAGDAFLECPLTLDDAAFSSSVNALDTKTISEGGTAIGEAINEARKAFKLEADNHKVLVLFTDGEDHDSDAVDAAKKAAKEGILIFTVGIGTPEGEQIRVRDEQGHVDTLMDENGKPVVSHLNEELLQQIATVTKGFYLPLRGTKTMDTLYDRGIAPLPKTDNAVRMFQHFREQYHWPLAGAILVLIAEMFLPDRSRRRSRRAPANNATATASTPSLTETAAIVLLLVLPLTVHGSPSSALREYNQGKYEDALKDYNQALEKKKDDPRLHFNAGTAAYQAHQLDEASKEFNEALATPDLQLQQRSYYNLGNTLYRIGQQESDASKKQEAWENSMKQFDSALKLNKQDADAKFNQEFVKKQLEELKKQQQQSQSQQNQDSKQQQQKNQQNQPQNQDQKGANQQQSSQSQQQNQDQNKQDQKSQAKEKSEQEKQQEQQQRQQNNSSQAKDKDQKSGADKQQQNADKQQGQAGNQDKNQSSEEAKREAAMMAAGQMTPRQAEQLLDSQKDEERVFQLAPPNKNVSQPRSYKNW